MLDCDMSGPPPGLSTLTFAVWLEVLNFVLRVNTAEEGFPLYQYQLQGKGMRLLTWHGMQYGTRDVVKYGTMAS